MHIIMTLLALALHAQSAPLSGKISLEWGADGAFLRVNIKNTSRMPICIRATDLPGYLSGDAVAISDSAGRALKYSGSRVQLSKSAFEEYIIMRPGQEVERFIHLRKRYRIKKRLITEYRVSYAFAATTCEYVLHHEWGAPIPTMLKIGYLSHGKDHANVDGKRMHTLTTTDHEWIMFLHSSPR